MAVLKIYGDIGECDPCLELFGIEGNNISSKDVSDFLDENENADEIIVRINSRGGDVQEGWAIYDLLTTSGKKIKTIGEGKIYSIATIIFLAGEEREIMQNADGLVHNPYIPPFTLADKYESDDLVKIAEGLAQEEEKILDFYAERTGTDKAKLAEYMKEETKLSAEDMLSLGFATKIIEPIKAYAYFNSKTILTMTPKEEAKFFEKVGNLLDSKLAKMFSRLPTENLELTDKDGKKFKIDKESGDPTVGDSASPDGTYTMANGDVIVIEEGKIKEITKSEPGELDKANAEIERLKGELAEAKTASESQIAESIQAKADYEAKATEASTLISELQALKNQWKPENRTRTGGKVDGLIDLEKVKEIQEKNKNPK